MPDWTDRNPADLGVTLAELFAYLGDRLAYWQDAAAYLRTAGRRTSVRRMRDCSTAGCTRVARPGPGSW